MTGAFAVQAHLASSGVSGGVSSGVRSGVSSGVFSTGLVPAVNVWYRVGIKAAGQADNTAGQADNTAGQEDNTAGGSLQALKADVADMAKLHAMSAGEVIATGLECCMHFHAILYCDCTCGCHACCMACLCGAGTA